MLAATALLLSIACQTKRSRKHLFSCYQVSLYGIMYAIDFDAVTASHGDQTSTLQRRVCQLDSLRDANAKAAFERMQTDELAASNGDVALVALHCEVNTVIVMSCPEKGTLNADGSAPYDQNVMDMCRKLMALNLLKVGFDFAGSSTTHAGDTSTFAEMTECKDMWKKLALCKSTRWFHSYCIASAGKMSMECQGFAGTVEVICIEGGLITMMEHQEMDKIVEDAKDDLAKNGVNECRIEIHKLTYFDFHNRFSPAIALLDETD